MHRHGVPETLTLDGRDAKEAALKPYNQADGTAIAIRQVKDRNKRVAQDQRSVKQITRPMRGCKSFAAAPDP